ncbi:MAG TPA: protein kinase [Terriglobales bacterium]|jgi:serine/threonine protein kinase/Tol biopolymer transport system component|nr:protein kinase [Terriglobales bacterium]
MPLASGTQLGPYEIQSPLGAGGMGEVYRARDTRLDRTVAIKVLASHLSSLPELKQRMEREARAISSLNHPNICHLYDIGSQEGTDYLVMEFLEGETLAERLRRGAMPFIETLAVGSTIAEALAVAHRQGIVHRDLKPGNIMLTKSGAKLMDFGLAKATPAGFDGASKAPVLSTAMTMSEASPLSPLTTAGSLIGTIQYMSPEQIEGKEADARSDLFALGGILYEMATGGRPFEGKSQISIASAILEKEPAPITSVQPATPQAFEHLVNTCLAKNPDDRFQTAHDVRLQLKWIAQSGASGVKPARKERSKRGELGWIAAGGLALLLMALAIWWRASKPDERTAFFAAPLPFSARDLAVSPNGHTVAVVGRESERRNLLWIYEPGSQEATSIANTEGANFPFWSADGRSLGFFADGRLKRVDITGGPVQTLSEAPNGRGGTWNKDGVILFTPSGQLGTGLYRIAASGGTPTQITFPDRERGEDSHRWPLFLPDGIHYLYLAMDLSGRKILSEIFLGSLNSNEKRLMTQAIANVAFAQPGYLLFYRNQTLFAQRFDTKKFVLSGEPTPILTDLQYLTRIARAVFASSDSGLLVAQKGGDTGVSQMLWFDRKGQQVGVASKPGVYGNLSLAPNGKFVAADAMDPGSQNTDVWTYDLTAESAKRLTFDPAIDSSPVWSPDSSRIVFCSDRAQRFNLYLKDATGAQDEKVIPQEGLDRYPTDWSHDGKYVLYERGNDLWFVSLSDLHNTLFLKGLSTPRAGRFSPDGKWVAYASNESGRWEVYVTSFPEAHGKWQVSNAGGEQPKWRSDGKEFYYLAPDGKIMAAPVTTGAKFDAGTPVALFQANPRELVATSEQSSYDVSKDGQKFLINTQLKTAMTPLSVVTNWGAKLGK